MSRFNVALVIGIGVIFAFACTRNGFTESVNNQAIDETFQRAVVSEGKDYQDAREALLKEGPDALRSFLMEKVEDDDWNVRMTARFILAWMDNPTVFAEIERDTGKPTRARNVYVFSGWRKYGVEVFPVLTEMVVKKTTLIEGPDLLLLRVENQRECKREAVKTKFISLLPSVAKPWRRDLALNVVSCERLRLLVLDGISYFGGLGFVGAWDWSVAELPSREENVEIATVLLEGSTLETVKRLIDESQDEREVVSLEVARYLLSDRKTPERWLEVLRHVESEELKKRLLGLLRVHGTKNMIPILEKMLKQVPEDDVASISLRNAYKDAIEQIRRRSGPEDSMDRDEAPQGEERPVEPSRAPAQFPWYLIIIGAVIVVGAIAAVSVIHFRRKR